MHNDHDDRPTDEPTTTDRPTDRSTDRPTRGRRRRRRRRRTRIIRVAESPHQPRTQGQCKTVRPPHSDQSCVDGEIPTCAAHFLACPSVSAEVICLRRRDGQGPLKGVASGVPQQAFCSRRPRNLAANGQVKRLPSSRPAAWCARVACFECARMWLSLSL